MEVHAHSHTERKKWTHFLWEFFMLFLAVTLGFFVENLREKQVEHHREKEYMESFLADTREDTIEINKSIAKASLTMRYLDTAILSLYNHLPVDTLSESFLFADSLALLRLKVIFNEGTAQQLKNSGNLRLIRNPDVARSISLYWNQQEYTKIGLDRYLEYRNRGREFAEKLFAFSDSYLIAIGLIKPSKKATKIIQASPALWAEYSNILCHCRVTVPAYIEQLKKQFSMAEDLIRLLQKEYHLE